MAKGWLWAADAGGCGWYRTVIVAEALRGLGHDVGQGITIDDDYQDADAVLGQRICIPGSSIAWARWNFQHEKTTVFDADDDYFHMYQHPEFGPAAVEYGNSRVQARLLANAASSTYTTCATPRIAEAFAPFCDNVLVVPNGLPERYLEVDAPYERRRYNPETHQYDDGYTSPAPPIVGWAGSSFTQWELTTTVKDALSRVDEWGGRLHVVGVPYPIMRKTGLVKPGVSVTGWIDGTHKYLDAIDFDIWVAPYRQSDYNNAKVATKALEAAFLGIPIVASATTPYRHFVQDGETGFLVEPGGDWETPIRTLINDPALRESMGRAARENAREFTIEKLAAQLWDPILFGDRK
jgi:glycosyltransferase involved in cell wall biosynthesis